MVTRIYLVIIISGAEKFGVKAHTIMNLDKAWKKVFYKTML